jgi:hypothetical protein
MLFLYLYCNHTGLSRCDHKVRGNEAIDSVSKLCVCQLARRSSRERYPGNGPYCQVLKPGYNSQQWIKEADITIFTTCRVQG